MAPFCVNCGTPLTGETATFCSKCGTPVAASPNSSIANSTSSVSQLEVNAEKSKQRFANGPKPVIAGILAGLFPFGVGAVYVGQYAKGWLYTIISFGLTFGMSQRSPISTVCGVVYAFYYVWQIIDTVRGAKAIRSAGVTTEISTTKRATTIAAMVLTLVTLAIVRIAVEDKLGTRKSAEAIADSSQTVATPLTSVSQASLDCVEGAKGCEGEAAAQWMGDEETHYINYSCRNPEAPQAVLKISLVRGAELDVANLHRFRYQGGASQQLWGAFVYNPPQYGEKSDGSYHLRGERQFSAPDEADITLELRPQGNRAKYFISARRSASTDEWLFVEEGVCSKVADKTGAWGMDP